MIYKGHSHQKFGCSTYSQHGEDLLFMNLCKYLNLEKPSYIDLGAYHPINISNTALLYMHGARGINVDANSFYMEEFSIHRPEDVNLNVGVDVFSRNSTFYIESENSVLNSFVDSSFEIHNTKSTSKRQIECLTVNEIIDKHWKGKFPDFYLSDIEGLDSIVLSMLDFSKSKPKVMCIEANTLPEVVAIKSSLQANGFSILCKMGPNIISIRKDLYPLCT